MHVEHRLPQYLFQIYKKNYTVNLLNKTILLKLGLLQE